MIESDQIPYPMISDELKELLYKDLKNLYSVFNGDVFRKARNIVSAFDVLCAHYVVCDYFFTQQSNKPIFTFGIKYPNLLISSVDRGEVSFCGAYKYDDIYKIISSIFYSLIKNHSFHDANKRTAFISLLYMIEKSNYVFTDGKGNELEDLTVSISNNDLHKFRKYKELKRKMSDDDAAVEFISHWLKKRMRKSDKRYYAITYRELDNRLRRYGFSLCDPDGNYIHICRNEKVHEKGGLLKKILKRSVKSHIKPRRLCKIGFPSWNHKVGKGAIKTILEKTHLKSEYGIDSGTFFKDEEPFYYLLSDYRVYIESLRDR